MVSSLCPAVLVFVVAVVLCVSPATLGCVLPPYFSPSSPGLSRHVRDITTNCGPNDTAPANRVNTTHQLFLLRQEMERENLAAYIIPIDEENRLEWVSGFSGSAGQAVVTLEEARLWTDGRYFLQAADQLDCSWYLMRMGEPGVATMENWILETLGGGGDEGNSTGEELRTGADPQLVGAGVWLDWLDKFGSSDSIELVEVDNLVDRVWTEENGRPPTMYKDIVIYDIEWAGESWTDKVGRVREELEESGVYGMVVTEVDEVSWLFNIRGEGESSFSGLMRSPLVEGMALLTKQEIILWLHLDKVSPELVDHLSPGGCSEVGTCVEVKEMEDSLQQLEDWADLHLSSGSKILVTKPSMYLAGASYAVYNSLPQQNRKLMDSPILALKSIKNKAEDDGMMLAHINDALALCDWAARLEYEIQELNSTWTEITAAELLTEYRLKQQNSKGPSFGTISAYGSNAAVIHYSPTPETDRQIGSDSLFLVDSGGQYLGGTTDVTRTFHYGQPTQEQIDRYTEVLQGAIDLASAVVPEDTLDTSVDLVTRQHLFNNGLNYKHGTGHGIGSYLKVHEGPTRIAMSSNIPSKLKPGMFFSDEPGYYKDGEFGIRLETILKVERKDFPDNDFGEFIVFSPVTLVPFEPKLINLSKLTASQIDWLNTYNSLVYDNIATRFGEMGNGRALDWVTARTATVHKKNLEKNYLLNDLN